MSFKVVIPARMASTRLPGKPLLDIAGKPMIQHVYERAKASAAEQIIIATDSEVIAKAAEQFGAQVCMTRPNHQSGTERLAEVAVQLGFNDDDLIVNVQGDEPCLPAVLINQVATDLAAHPKAAITTLFSPIHEVDEVFDPNIVKVVLDARGYALYFSRAAVPWLRDAFAQTPVTVTSLPHVRHIGLYAYRAGYLHRYSELAASPLERHESLEQLRALYHGHKIHLTEAVVHPGHGVDTEADLMQVRALMAQVPNAS